MSVLNNPYAVVQIGVAVEGFVHKSRWIKMALFWERT